MSKPDIASLRAQVRADATASVMQIIGAANEAQAEWLADRLVARLDALLEPADNVIQIDPNAPPSAVMEQINELSADLARSAFIAAKDLMLAGLALGLKVGGRSE